MDGVIRSWRHTRTLPPTCIYLMDISTSWPRIMAEDTKVQESRQQGNRPSSMVSSLHESRLPMDKVFGQPSGCSGIVLGRLDGQRVVRSIYWKWLEALPLGSLTPSLTVHYTGLIPTRSSAVVTAPNSVFLLQRFVPPSILSIRNQISVSVAN